MKIIHSVLTTEACCIPRLCLALALPVLVPSSTLEILDRLSVACMQRLYTSLGRSAVALALGLCKRFAFIAFLTLVSTTSFRFAAQAGWCTAMMQPLGQNHWVAIRAGCPLFSRCCGEQTLRIHLLICAQGFRAISMPVARHSCTDLLDTVPSWEQLIRSPQIVFSFGARSD